MLHLYRYLPVVELVIALALLAFGVLAGRKVSFIGSLGVLIITSFTALVLNSPSNAGGLVFIFGVACLVLGRKQLPRPLVPSQTLRQIGTAFAIVGLAGSIMI